MAPVPLEAVLAAALRAPGAAVDAAAVPACCSACINRLPKLAAPWTAAAAKGFVAPILPAQTEGFKTLEMDTC